ncbi:diguanylate cyclase [Azospirillum halopraeferens]|uniref:diguanylate cyclase n=1 Tax=Azospirillum halopraeferens TaxID=34010 RepID=UPI000419298A|nr:diguanylate cyclase [Azospirillum halopraeferens]
MMDDPASLFSLPLDPRTIALVIAVSSLSIAMAVLFSARTYRPPTSRSMMAFGIGKLLGAAGFTLITLRGYAHPALSVVLGNGLAMAAFCLNLTAVRILQGRSAAYGFAAAMTGIMAASSAFFTMAAPSLQGLRLATSAVSLIVCAVLGYELLVRYRGPGRAHRLAGAIVLLMGSILVLRFGDALITDTSPAIVLSSGAAEKVFLLGAYLAITVASLNFILMYNDAFNEELRRLARVDPLTGVANRRSLFERADEEVRRADRFGHALTVLVLDIDHFKRINDGWGHGIGDRALEAVAACCRDGVRDVDTVARLGGEEFVILLPQTTAAAGRAVAERLRAAVDTLAVAAQPPLRLTASIGVAERVAQEGFDSVLSRADAALYAAKAAGRDRVATAETAASSADLSVA